MICFVSTNTKYIVSKLDCSLTIIIEVVDRLFNAFNHASILEVRFLDRSLACVREDWNDAGVFE